MVDSKATQWNTLTLANCCRLFHKSDAARKWTAAGINTKSDRPDAEKHSELKGPSDEFGKRTAPKTGGLMAFREYV
jgi:hypothetical protein